jgi:hypothetical protein
MDKKTEIGRLALRHEGEWWNAYWAPNQHNMEKALLLGTIRMSCVRGSIREEFIDLMRRSFANIVKDETGLDPTWDGEKPAPERERSGHG